MTEIEKMRRYIELTKIRNSDRYYIDTAEAFELAKTSLSSGSLDDYINAISLAFNYGKAKGYRAAKAEVRKEGVSNA